MVKEVIGRHKPSRVTVIGASHEASHAWASDVSRVADKHHHMLRRLLNGNASAAYKRFGLAMGSYLSSSSPSQGSTMSAQETVDVCLLPASYFRPLLMSAQNAVAKGQVTIFSKSWCPYCRSAKSLFASEFPEIEATIFEYIPRYDISGWFSEVFFRLDERADGAAIQQYLYKKTGQRTVPNIFVSMYFFL